MVGFWTGLLVPVVVIAPAVTGLGNGADSYAGVLTADVLLDASNGLAGVGLAATSVGMVTGPTASAAFNFTSHPASFAVTLALLITKDAAVLPASARDTMPT
ncbi:hypothetical protein D3C85_1120530 [compost metagenome]